MFHQLSEHLESCRQTDRQTDITFSTLFLVFGHPDETLCLVFGWFKGVRKIKQFSLKSGRPQDA